VRLSPEAVRLLASAEWPGNVRELENIVSRAVLRASAAPDRADSAATVTPAHLDIVAAEARERVPPVDVPQPGEPERPLRERLEDFERRAILEAVGQNGGNWAAAARSLGVHRSNLHHRAARLGLKSGGAQ
jgi:anaerobic nitric oxide reductase transcription regulator